MQAHAHCNIVRWTLTGVRGKAPHLAQADGLQHSPWICLKAAVPYHIRTRVVMSRLLGQIYDHIGVLSTGFVL
jgi:hypothetical protein